MGQATDRWIMVQNILAKYGGVDKVDLASELAKVQALINITGMKPQPIAPQNFAPSPQPQGQVMDTGITPPVTDQSQTAIPPQQTP